MMEAVTEDRVVVTLGELIAAVSSVSNADDEVTAVLTHLFRTGVCASVTRLEFP